MSRPLFELSPRLALCARLVRKNRPVCDVGTDHAYLPIWLIKSGATPRAVAADVNEGPLKAAEANAVKYCVGDALALRLSNGLREISPEEADDVVIAGMGGELILSIIEEAGWLRDGSKYLVLQPMSAADVLRAGLKRLGFSVLEEYAVEDSGKVYTAFSAEYIGKTPETDELYPYLGKLEINCAAAKKYAQKQVKSLHGKLKGAMHGRAEASPDELKRLIDEIEMRCREV